MILPDEGYRSQGTVHVDGWLAAKGLSLDFLPRARVERDRPRDGGGRRSYARVMDRPAARPEPVPA